MGRRAGLTRFKPGMAQPVALSLYGRDIIWGTITVFSTRDSRKQEVKWWFCVIQSLLFQDNASVTKASILNWVVAGISRFFFLFVHESNCNFHFHIFKPCCSFKWFNSYFHITYINIHIYSQIHHLHSRVECWICYDKR